MEEKGKEKEKKKKKHKKNPQQQRCTRETKPELVTSLLILYSSRSQLQQTPPNQEDPCPEVLTNPASCKIIKRQTRQQGTRRGEGTEGGKKGTVNFSSSAEVTPGFTLKCPRTAGLAIFGSHPAKTSSFFTPTDQLDGSSRY